MLVESGPQHVIDQPIGGAGAPLPHRPTSARRLVMVAAAVVLAVACGAFAGSRLADREAPSARRAPTPKVITPARVVVAIPDLAGGRIAALKDRPAKPQKPSASGGSTSAGSTSAGSTGGGSSGSGSTGGGSTGGGSTGGGSSGGGSTGGGSSGGGPISSGGGED
jgi:hypothetical protein